MGAPKRAFLVTMLVLIVAFGCATPQPSADVADTVYTNGRIYTVDETQPWAEALAVKDGRLLVVGSGADVEAVTGDGTQIVDLGGRFVMPGINDLHHHGIDISTTAMDPNALAIAEDQKGSPEAIVAAIKEYAESHPDLPLIYVEDFPDGMFPGNNGPKEMLDEADRDRPIIVLSSGGHAFWGNSKALEAAGISADTPDPEYGLIGRKTGSMEPIGGVHENAMQLFWALKDMPTRESIAAGVREHVRRINALGVTGVRIGGITQNHLEETVAADEAGELNAYHSLAFHWRTSYIAQREQDLDLIRQQILESKSLATENVASGVLKYYADGAPASKTSYLLEDYENDPGNRSQLQMDEGLFQEEFAFWTKNGITTMTHVTGDAAARSVIDAVEAAQATNGKNGVRHHMTHSVMIAPADLARLKPLGMVVDVSPAVAAPMTFHDAYKHHYGERHEQFFPARGLIDAGANFMVASDFPVGPDNPWTNIETWTTRMNPWGDADGTLGAQSAISLEEALEAATLAGAYGLYMEDEFGSLEAGKRATFIVLNHNLFEIPPADLSETEVVQTYFNGRLVYDVSRN